MLKRKQGWVGKVEEELGLLQALLAGEKPNLYFASLSTELGKKEK